MTNVFGCLRTHGGLLLLALMNAAAIGCGASSQAGDRFGWSICPVAKHQTLPSGSGSMGAADWDALVARVSSDPLEPARRLSACPTPSSDEYYFKARTFYPVDSVYGRGREAIRIRNDAFIRGWYSGHLRAMQERSLSCGERGRARYRLLLLPTWAAPIAVRIDVGEGSAVLNAVELSGAGGYAPGVPTCRVTRDLSRPEQRRVVAALEKAAFWNLETIGGERGLDGTHWVMEGRASGAYHVVDRWSPEGGAYLELGKLFLQLAGYRESKSAASGYE